MGMLKRRKQKGQSTLEYIILVAAVIAIIIAFLAPNGPFRTRLNSTLQSSADTLGNFSTRLNQSYPNL